jgi:tRNA (cmo5U34)-methyltransferase
MSAPKSFDDAGEYEREIRLLVPGYGALHSLLPAVAEPWLAREGARGLSVGCGTGAELVGLLRAHPGCVLDGVDPSAAMCTVTRALLAKERLGDRCTIRQGTLADVEEAAYDLVAAVLVGHVIRDDGARASFLRDIGRALRPRGGAILVELEDSLGARAYLTDTHVGWSRAMGMTEERLAILRERLTTGFHPLTRARLTSLACDAGLEMKAEFFRALGVIGVVLGRGGRDA